MEGSEMSMKLLIDTKSKRVLFAEASKDCVDFLFLILSLPLATVIRLVTKQGMVGSVAKLYESLENLDESYIQPGQNKDFLLKPMTLSLPPSNIPLLLRLREVVPPTQIQFYTCCKCNGFYFSKHDSHFSRHVSDDPSSICPKCLTKMTLPLSYLAPTNSVKNNPKEGGLVRVAVTYMVTDDLEVKPMSAISVITLLSTSNIKDLSCVQEKMVEVSMNEAVMLLKSSLHNSDMVLTEVFLNSKCTKATTF